MAFHRNGSSSWSIATRVVFADAAAYQLDGRQGRFRRAKSEIHRIVDDIIYTRKIAGPTVSGEETDYLSALLANTEKKDHSFIRDILVTLLFAGRESTQNTINWMMYEITPYGTTEYSHYS